MVTGIPYSENNAELRRLWEQFCKEKNNFKKSDIARKMYTLKIPSGAFPEDWDETIPHKKNAICERSMLFCVVNKQYFCYYFKEGSTITYDKIGISWDEKNLKYFEILDQVPLR